MSAITIMGRKIKMKPYVTEPLTDFSDERNKKDFEKALTHVQSQLGKDYPLIIGKEELVTDKK